MNHGWWWNVQEGQLAENEEVFCGFATKEQAEQVARMMSCKREVRLLRTTESNCHPDDPVFAPFASERWCIVQFK